MRDFARVIFYPRIVKLHKEQSQTGGKYYIVDLYKMFV